jgi:(R,R)-butanediol dehydrogenase/meso-butanediol dehydrogenase/diacetyl reductase
MPLLASGHGARLRAAVYHGPRDVRFEEVPDPVAAPGDLLIDVATVGICGTDVADFVNEPHFFPTSKRHPHSGHLGPTIPGHEFSGVVAEVGAGVEGFAVGDLVASGAGVSCGVCLPCRRGATNMCDNYWTVGLHANGAMAEKVAVPASCCLNVSNHEIASDIAALAQPMSIAVHAARRGRMSPDDLVLIVGVGGIGSFLTYCLAAQGAEVMALDLDPGRLEMAIELGASTTVDAAEAAGLVDHLASIGKRPTLVFECTANPEALDSAARVVADNGKVVVVGHQPHPFDFDFKVLTFGEKELIGTMAHAFNADFADAVELLTRSPDVWAHLAPTVHPLEALMTAGLIPMAEHRQSQVKTLFDPSLREPRPLRPRI